MLFVRQPGTPVVSLSGSGGTGIRNDRVLYRLRLYVVIFGLRGWRQMTGNEIPITFTATGNIYEIDINNGATFDDSRRQHTKQAG